MSEVLVEVTRGDVVECTHRGDIAVVDKNGRLLYYAGDPYKFTYSRSSAKPIQTMEVIISGAADRFGFTDAELSLMSASHYAEDYHLGTVMGISEKIGVSVNNFLCGAAYSINSDYAFVQAKSNVILNPVYNDCSGKHSGMLAVCVHKGYPLDNYISVDHPHQKRLKQIISYIYDLPEDEIKVGVDGCDVPVFAMPLYNMAYAYARFTNPDVLKEPYRTAAERIFDAMNNNPEMVAGTNGFCTELIKNTGRKLIGKLGAEGIYCIGLKGLDIGIAIKIEDGNIQRAISPSAMEVLEQLELLNEKESKSLKHFRIRENTNSVGNVVGYIKPAFKLKKA